MNVVNKYIATLSLVVGTLGAQIAVAAEAYTRDVPNLIQCDTCYSVADFERKAKTQAQSNTAGYHLVYNMNTEVVETVYTFELYEPELGISMSNARVVSSQQAHLEDFSLFVKVMKFGEELLSHKITINMPGRNLGMVELYYQPVTAAIAIPVAAKARKPLTGQLPWIVTVEHENGDVVTVKVYPGLASTAIELIEAVDKNGQPLPLNTSGSTGSAGGGSDSGTGGTGSGGGSSTLPSGIPIGGKYGMCTFTPSANGGTLNCKFV